MKNERSRRGAGTIYQQWGRPYNIKPEDWKALTAEEKQRQKVLLSPNWYCQYYREGRVYRECTGTANKREAERTLAQKLGEIATGRFVDPKTKKTLVRELAKDLFTDYAVNLQKTLDDTKTRWVKHLEPTFGNMRADQVTFAHLRKYQEQRLAEGASNATINREIAALKRAFNLGKISGKVQSVPPFPHLKEDNTRQGFLPDEQYTKLAQACAKQGLWLRAMLEVGCSFGWRVGELLNLRVNQLDLASRTIRLNAGETKNDAGRVAVMTGSMTVLLTQCITGKRSDDFVFTRSSGKPVRDFRGAWSAACAEAGVRGLLFHDLRRTGVRNMILGGVSEAVAMRISGHKTRSMLDRYTIVSQADLEQAATKIEQRRHKTDINPLPLAQPTMTTQVH